MGWAVTEILSLALGEGLLLSPHGPILPPLSSFAPASTLRPFPRSLAYLLSYPARTHHLHTHPPPTLAGRQAGLGQELCTESWEGIFAHRGSTWDALPFHAP